MKARTSPAADPNESDELRWMGEYPITRNKTVTLSLLAVSTISVGLVALFVIGLAIQDEDYEFAVRLMGIFGGIWLGFTLVLFLIGAVFFGGKVPMEVAIDERGIVQTIHSRRAKAANALSVLGGAAVGGARGATAAGAGLIAASRQTEGREFRDLRSVLGNPESGEIRLRDDWHTVLQVYAPPEHYEEAMARLEAGIERASKKRPPAEDIPGAVKALVILGAVVFGTFLLAGFPLAFSVFYIVPMFVLTVGCILSPPVWRARIGWVLAGLVMGVVGYLFATDPPRLGEPGARTVLILQLLTIGLFILFGICAGFRVFERRKPKTLN